MSGITIIPLLSAVILLFLGAFALGRNSSRSLNRVFFALSSLMGSWALCEFGCREALSFDAARLWVRAQAFSALGPPLLVHLVILFGGKKPSLRKPLFLTALYAPAFVFIAAELFFGALWGLPVHRPWGWARGVSPAPAAFWAYVVWASACAVFSVVLSAIEFVRTPDPEKKSSLGTIIFSVSVLTCVGLFYDVLKRIVGLEGPDLMLSTAGLVGIFLSFRMLQGELFGTSLAAANEDIIDIAADCLVLVGQNDRIIRVNQATLRLLGYSERELIDASITKVFERGSYDSTLFRETRLDELEKSGYFNDIGAVFVGKGGQRIPVSVSESLLKTKTGRRIGVVLFARDLSGRRKLEEELQRAQKLDSLGKLARGVAHDLNNILTAVLGNISLSRSKIDRTSDLHRILRSAEKAALLAKGLSRQLLTFSRGGDPDRKPASIGKLVADTVEFTMRGAEVTCDYQIPADLRWAEVDQEQIGQVIANLVINAKQAMPRNGLLSVRCKNARVSAGTIPHLAEGPYVEIAIQDTGIGIGTDEIDKIFDPFYTTKSRGSGLGLAVSLSIVRKHGGALICESIEGVGSTFRVYLPACETVSLPEDTAIIRLEGSARILVLDDDEVVRLTFENILLDLGYTVDTAAEGGEAIDKYMSAKKSERPYDVVIMDLMIPGGMGGKDAIARLLELDPKAIAVVTSGYSDDPVIANYRAHGFVGVLHKPFKIDELSAVVEQALRTASTRSAEA